MIKNLIVFLRFVSASGIATGVDFGMAYTFLHTWSWSPTLATVLGNVAGALVGFWISKQWVFKSTSDFGSQAIKYALVASGNSLMNTTGVWLLTLWVSWHYLLVRIIVALFVFVVYSYGLNQWFVFKEKNHEELSI